MFSKKTIFIICSHGHEESRFDNPSENVLTEGRKCFTQCPKSTNRKSNIFEKTIVYQNGPMETWDAVLTTPLIFFWQEGETFSLNVKKR